MKGSAVESFLKILPLVIVLVVLLPPFRFHVLVAGLTGGAAAVVIGALTPGEATGAFFDGIVQIMSIASVMVFAATAMVLARAGSTRAMLTIIQRIFKERFEFVAAGMVLVQALAVYAAGIGAANTLVTAPLIFAVTGFVPALVAGHGIVSSASWATSPASAESAFISEQMGLTAPEYSAFMRPFTVTLWAIGILLAWYGVRRYRRAGKLQPPPPEEIEAVPVEQSRAQNPGGEERTGATGGEPSGPGEQHASPDAEVVTEPGPWRLALPFFLLLFLIVFGPPLNELTGVEIFTNLTTPLIVLATASVSMWLNPNRIGEMFLDGGLTILRYLFLVGVFLGFINMLGEIGTFETIADLVAVGPAGVITAGALIGGFVVAVPSAAYTVAVIALILPVLGAAGVTASVFGFVGIAVAQGAMISPVQINVAATAHGFRKEILDICRNNLPFMPVVFLLTLVVGVIVTAVTG